MFKPLGNNIHEEFAILMEGFEHRSPEFKEFARQFFACGAMAAASLVVRDFPDVDKLKQISRDIHDLMHKGADDVSGTKAVDHQVQAQKENPQAGNSAAGLQVDGSPVAEGAKA